MRQMLAQIETAENSQKTSSAECNELKSRQTKLQTDLKVTESKNEELLKQQKMKSQEIQTLSQTIASVNDQLSSKVIEIIVHPLKSYNIYICQAIQASGLNKNIKFNLPSNE